MILVSVRFLSVTVASNASILIEALKKKKMFFLLVHLKPKYCSCQTSFSSVSKKNGMERFCIVFSVGWGFLFCFCYYCLNLKFFEGVWLASPLVVYRLAVRAVNH